MPPLSLAARLVGATVLTLMPRSGLARRLRLKRAMDLGIECCRKDDLLQAEALFRSAREMAESLNSDGFELGKSQYNLARVLSLLDQFDEAEAVYQKAIEIFQNNPDSSRTRHVDRSAIELVRVYRARRKFDGAYPLDIRCLIPYI